MNYYPGVDLVVVNYRTPHDLEGFLQSYQDAKLEVPHALHVVNVCPSIIDEDVVNHASRRFPFLYTKYEENVGYATACNNALSIPDRETVFLLNADTRLLPGVVEGCHSALHEHDDWAVLGPKQVDDHARIVSGGVYGTQSAPTFDGRWRVLDVRERFSDVRTDAINVSGSAYMMKRKVWDELSECPEYRSTPLVVERKPYGPLLPTRHYYEETYLSYHALAHGYKVVYYGKQKMIHRFHKSMPEGSRRDNELLVESRRAFREACRHHGITCE